MDVRQFFNIVLLSLILTTLLVTLVVYLVFKFRQGIQVIKGAEDSLDGEFFTRYAPHILQEIKRKKEQVYKELNDSFWVRNKTRILVIGTFSLVLGLLLLENYISYRRDLHQRQVTAQEYLDLIKKGLLKDFSFNPASAWKDFVFAEGAEHPLEDFYKNRLKTKRFAIYTSTKTIERYSYVAQNSLANWDQFCRRQGLSCERIISLEQVGDHILIVPQSLILDDVDRKTLSQMMESRHPVVYTGASGYFDGSNGKSRRGWLLSHLPLLVDYSAQRKKSAPSIFLPSTDLFLHSPLQQFSYHSPLTETFKFFTTSESSDNQKQDLTNLNVVDRSLNEIRYLSRKKDQGYFWTSLDPVQVKGELSVRTAKETDFIFLQALYHVGFPDEEQVYLSLWPNHAKTGVGVALTASENFESINTLLETMGAKKFKTSVYLQADMFDRLYMNFKKKYLESKEIEIGVAGADARTVDRLTAAEAFQFVEDARLLVERRARRKVYGIRPTVNHLPISMFSGAEQNELMYILGNSSENLVSPQAVGTTGMYSLRLDSHTDGALMSDPLVIDPKDVYKRIQAAIQQKQSLGAPYVLGLDTAIFGLKKNEPFLTGALSALEDAQDIWWGTVYEIVDRYKTIQLLQISYEDNGWYVNNISDKVAKNISLRFNEGAKIINSPNILSKTSSNQIQVTIVEVPPGEKLQITDGFEASYRKPATSE